MPGPTAAIVSFRLGGTDGVAIEAAKWQWALGQLGFDVVTVAGEGPVDHLLPGLAMGAPEPPTTAEVQSALAGADVAVVENICSLPLNPRAADVLTRVLRSRRAVMHHHDLPWQREQTASMPPPSDDSAWIHVTVNELSRRELAERAISATAILNCFDTDAGPGDRERTREHIGVSADELVVLQPTRAIPRKNVPGGIELARSIGAAYWLLGAAEDGYGPQLERLLTAAPVPVLRGFPATAPATSMTDVYAACDVVVMPSHWEGFGNPAVESAIHRRPLSIAPYPVALELEAFGFRWFRIDRPLPLVEWLRRPDTALLEDNLGVARRSFSLADLPERLARVMDRAGWAW